MKTLITALEEDVFKAADELKIGSTNYWYDFYGVVDQLRVHNQFMYDHSLRVGLYCYGLGKAFGYDELVLRFMSGCGHDVGKCFVPNEILNKTTMPTEEEFEIIHTHPVHSYNMLKDVAPATAIVCGLHHYFGPKHYGIDPDVDIPAHYEWDFKEEMCTLAKYLSMCDFFDAMTTRRNASSLIEDMNDKHAIFKMMLKYFPGHGCEIQWLINHKI